MGKFLLVVITFAALVYAALWLIEQHRARPAQPRRVRRPVAPDDDETFLRDLDRKRREHGDT